MILLVHHVATGEAQAALMKTSGHKLQAGRDHRSGCLCLDVTDANNI